MARHLYLHIGLNKTGTTFLQEWVFPTLPLTYIFRPRSLHFKDEGYLGVIGYRFAGSLKVWEERGDALLEDILGPPGSGTGDVLISDEGMGGVVRNPDLVRLHLRAMAERAKAWGFDGVRILCAIRRQDQWMGSQYAQVSDRNPSPSQADFEAWAEWWIDPARGYYREGIVLDYKVLRDGLEYVAGPGNVLVLPYERLQEDAGAFIADIAAFLGGVEAPSQPPSQRSNVRSTGDDRWALRPPKKGRRLYLRPGRLFRALGLPTYIPLWKKRGEVVMAEDLRRRILAAYEESNRAVASDLGVDLGAYGYY